MLLFRSLSLHVEILVLCGEEEFTGDALKVHAFSFSLPLPFLQPLRSQWTDLSCHSCLSPSGWEKKGEEEGAEEQQWLCCWGY